MRTTKLLFLWIFIFVWQWSFAQISWIQKANFPGADRTMIACFSIGNYGYIGCGYDGSYFNDFYKWDQITNTWSAIASYPGQGLFSPTSFTINGKGYVGLGQKSSFAMSNDLWRYDPIANTWTAMASFPFSAGGYDAPCFVINNKCYVICMSNGGPPYNPGVWVYDAAVNTWTQKSNFPGGDLEGLLTFTIGKVGYAGCGWDGSNAHNTMWRYDTLTDSWTSIAPVPTRLSGFDALPRSFIIGSKAYVCTGRDGTGKAAPNGYLYDTVTKSWCKFSFLGKLARAYGAGFGINNKGYIGVGTDTNGVYSGPFANNFYEYSPTSTFLASDTSSCGSDTVHFSGITTFDSTDMGVSWSWTFTGGNPASSVSQYPLVVYSTPGTYQVEAIITSCAGSDTVIRNIHVTSTRMPITAMGNKPLCGGGTDTLTATGGGTYLWSTGATTSSIVVNPASTTTYTVHITNGACVNDTILTVNVSVINATLTPPPSSCNGFSDTLIATGGGTYLWSTGATTSSIIVSPGNTTTYTLQIRNGSCVEDTSITVTVHQPFRLNLSPPQKLCEGSSDTLTATGGCTYLWSNGATTNSIIITPASNGVFTVTASCAGCKDTSASVAVKVYSLSLTACCDTSITEGNSVIIHASGSNNYSWSPNTGLSCDTCANPVASPSVTTTYTVTTTDSLGCKRAELVEITIETPCLPDFQVPNVFTPNGDGINDVFQINCGNTSTFSIQIFNRWGQEVFTSYLPKFSWDGRTPAGVMVSDGVYYYILNASCKSQTYQKHGFVQIISEKVGQ